MTRKMKDSGIEWIGEIPEDWGVVPARYFFKANKKIVGNKENEYERLSLTMKGVLKKSKYNSEGLQPSNFNSYQILTKNQLVFKLIDLQNVSTSRVGISPYKGIVSPAYVVIDSKDTKTNNKFYYYWYMSMYLNKVFNLLGDAGVRSNINATELLELKVPRTNFREQNIISDFLDKKTEQIENIKSTILQEIQILEDYKSSLITEAVTKGLDKNVEMKDSGIEWIGKIPKHWKVIRIKNAALLKARIGWQGLRSDEFLDDINLPYLVTGTDFKEGFVDWKNCVRISEKRFEMDKNIQIKENDLLITKDGTIGKLAISKNCPCKASLNSGVFVIRNNGPYKYCDKYMYYLLQSEQFLLWFELNDAGNSTIRHLYQKDFYNFSFTYPEEREQEKIALYLDKKTKIIDEAICSKQKQLEILEEYKKSLIYEYVTGKKEVE